MNLLLINSGDADPFTAIFTNGSLNIYRASEYLLPGNLREKKPDKLINCLDALSNDHDLKQIDAIAITIGPGSFTGVRVGLSLAKGLAHGLNIKLIPITNFRLTLNRLDQIKPEFKYCTIIPAKLPEYYFSYTDNDRVLKHGCAEMKHFDEFLTKDTFIVGDFDDETELKHSYFEYINVKNLTKEADSMAELAAAAVKDGKVFDAEDIEPLYLKDFNIKK